MSLRDRRRAVRGRLRLLFFTFLWRIVTGKCTPKWPRPSTLRDLRVRECSFWSFWTLFDLLINGPVCHRWPGLPTLARSANVGPFNTAVGGPQRAPKVAFARTSVTNSCTKWAPPASAGPLQVQITSLRQSATTPALGPAFRWEGSRVEDLKWQFAGPLGSSNGRIEWSNVGRPGQRWQTGPLIN